MIDALQCNLLICMIITSAISPTAAVPKSEKMILNNSHHTKCYVHANLGSILQRGGGFNSQSEALKLQFSHPVPIESPKCISFQHSNLLQHTLTQGSK